jgi:hypothetical protein
LAGYLNRWKSLGLEGAKLVSLTKILKPQIIKGRMKEPWRESLYIIVDHAIITALQTNQNNVDKIKHTPLAHGIEQQELWRSIKKRISERVFAMMF